MLYAHKCTYMEATKEPKSLWNHTWKLDSIIISPFTSRIHQMFSPICFTYFFNKFLSVWAFEKENTLLILPKLSFFSQFVIWKRNHNKYLSKNFLFTLGIRDWWNHLMNSLVQVMIWSLYISNVENCVK